MKLDELKVGDYIFYDTEKVQINRILKRKDVIKLEFMDGRREIFDEKDSIFEKYELPSEIQAKEWNNELTKISSNIDKAVRTLEELKYKHCRYVDNCLNCPLGSYRCHFIREL